MSCVFERNVLAELGGIERPCLYNRLIRGGGNKVPRPLPPPSPEEWRQRMASVFYIV